MTRMDRHVHTTFSDGEATPEAMVQAAIRDGLSVIGFSDHAYTPFDESYCIPRARLADYRAEIARLADVYRDRITVLCGIEQDYYAEPYPVGYDYVIGSVHYLACGDTYVAIDEDWERLQGAADRYFGGDTYALTELYYRTVADLVRRTGATIIGHFDLITKFTDQRLWFDPSHPRYRAAWQAAADALLLTGVPLEINTGAMARGDRTVPYPAPEIRDYWRAHGGQFVLSSDCHDTETLCFGFDRFSL